MIAIQEVWIDTIGEASAIRMSARPEEVSGLNLHEGQNLVIDVAGRNGLIGAFRRGGRPA